MNKPMRGIEVVITGRLSEPRKVFKALIREAGGILCEKVYKRRTRFVVIGVDRDGTPIRRDKYWVGFRSGIRFINEAELRNLIEYGTREPKSNRMRFAKS